MSAPRRFDEETRARAVRLYRDRLRDHGESKLVGRIHKAADFVRRKSTVAHFFNGGLHQILGRPNVFDPIPMAFTIPHEGAGSMA